MISKQLLKTLDGFSLYRNHRPGRVDSYSLVYPDGRIERVESQEAGVKRITWKM